jgi:hypothetical protein
MKICVYAFSNPAYFFSRLMARSQELGDGVEWSVIVPRWQHWQRMAQDQPRDRVMYLYEHFDARYEEIGETGSFGFSSPADNELVCLLKDKGGYRRLDGREQLRRATAVVSLYREFLERVRPEYMLFPDLEVVDGFLLLSLCRTLGVKPIYYVGMRFLGGGFFAQDCYETLPSYFGPHDEGDLRMAREYLEGFLAGKTIRIDAPYTAPPTLPVDSLWKRAPRALHWHWRHEKRYVGEDSWPERIRANLAKPLNTYRAWYFRTFQLRWFDLLRLDQPLPAKFVLYALQYTPESSINGLEPYYVDQLRAVDLLLAGMPSDYRLVVKEHPSIVGIRTDSFYRELRRRPGVVLAAPGLPSRRLLERAELVATVTGTIGLEGYLSGKPALLFGRNFFSHLCGLGDGPSSIKSAMARLLDGQAQPSLEERAVELARLLHVRYPIHLSDPLAEPVVMSEQNIVAFHHALHDHIARCRAIDASPST